MKNVSVRRHLRKSGVSVRGTTARAGARGRYLQRNPRQRGEVQDAQDLIAGKPLLYQIGLLYYRFARGERDNSLANYVLDQLGKFDYAKFYEKQLQEEHGFTSKQMERELDKLWKRMEKAGYDERDEYLNEVDDPFPYSMEEVEEIENIDESIIDLKMTIAHAEESGVFGDKLQAIDIVMHNFHAGIAPLEVIGVSRDDLFHLAEFLKHADVDQLGFVLGNPEPADNDKMVEVAPQFRASRIEGYLPSGRPIREGD